MWRISDCFQAIYSVGGESFRRKWMLKFSKECSRCTTRNEHPHEGPSQAQELVGFSGACLHGWLQVTPGRQEKVSSSRQRERV